MDQSLEYVSYRNLLQAHNITVYDEPFNISQATDILDEFERSFHGPPSYNKVILLSLYAPVFLVALLGNLLVLATVVRERMSLGKAKNLYLLNLAVADLLVTLLCMPAAVGTLIYRLWLYGVFLCKFTAFLQGVAVTSSIFTLTAMSVDRYISIQHPMALSRVTSARQALAIMAVMWTVAGTFMAPLLYVRQVDTVLLPDLPPMTFCIENWPRDYDRHAFGCVLVVVIFILPSATLGICYVHVGRTLCSTEPVRQLSDLSVTRTNSRKRAARMLITLVVIFVACWLPYNITSLCIDLTEDTGPVDFLPFALWLGHAHSAINPLMYWAMNRRFREDARNLMKAARHSLARFCEPAPRFV
ncbi:hypothetical protein BaRGS_00027414 [Batillaria attramentaria]|uniref:G-protein coupled receptors family 1 profile domain-containing protein n=1 Tax=Batillaria attramentaria TaxID=370345 RepID=A0ABD0K2S0_9CAEN|nr:hypothetical protein BaRGS_028240 [Batillaria attramentaria]